MPSIDDLDALSSPEEAASAFMLESKARGHSRPETIAEASTGKQESGWRMVKNPTADWFGYFQQDASYPNRRSPAGNIRGFLDRLEDKRPGKPGASEDPFKNIFWLQQGPNWPSADYAYDHGRRAYYHEIRQHIDWATALYDRVVGGDQPTNGGTVGVSGDPVWLEDVLRPVLGNRLRTLPGWQDSGVGGTMGNIWGVIWHHTGNANASAQSIRDGRPDLAGPLSQLHMAQDGTVTIVAVGPCNHAGAGSWAGLPTDNANERTIGIEMAWPRDLTITEATQRREEWPAAMITSIVDVGAALALKIGNGAANNISHSEWARFGPAGWRQGKWDPGNLNMGVIRDRIAVRMAQLQGGPPPPPPPPPPATDRQLLERLVADVSWLREQLGPGHPDWNPIQATERPGIDLTLRDGLDVLVERGNQS